MSKPFFVRIDIAELLDFATDPEGDGMSVLRLAKELQRGQSDVAFIQKTLDEARNYVEKKRKAGSEGGKAKASSAMAVLSSAIAKPSTPLASNRSSNNSSTETEEETTPPPMPFTELKDRFLSLAGRLTVNPGEVQVIKDISEKYTRDKIEAALMETAASSPSSFMPYLLKVIANKQRNTTKGGLSDDDKAAFLAGD